MRKERAFFNLAFAATIFVVPALSIAADLHIPRQYRTIQEAVEAAASGDRLLLKAGTYSGSGNSQIDFRGKELQLIGVDGAENTIIDSLGRARTMRLASGESSASIIRGIQFRNGTGQQGASVYLQGTSPRFIRCRFEGGASTRGGSVHIVGGAPSFERCEFTNGEADQGGAVFASQTSARFLDCLFVRNSAREGGAIYVESGALDVRTSKFLDNAAAGDGAAVFLLSGSANFEGDVFGSNLADGRGGAIFLSAGSLAKVVHSTLSANKALSGAGGLHADGAGSASIANSILWENGNLELTPGIAVRNSCVKGGAPGWKVIDDDPLVVDAGNHQYRLQANSPCIEGGAFIMGLGSVDVDGRPRIAGWAPDMGAFEHFVDAPDPLLWLEGDSELSIPHDGTPETDTIQVGLRGSGFDWLLEPLSFRWTLEGDLLGTDPNLTTTLRAGVAAIRLQISDERGAMAASTFNVRVHPEPNEAPIAHVTRDFRAVAENGSATVVLQGGGVDIEGDPLSYQWSSKYSVVSTSNRVELVLPLGRHSFRFRVSDSYGAYDEELVTVRVVAKPTIRLNGANPMGVEAGTAFLDPGATATDPADGVLAVTVLGSVNAGALGTTVIAYSATNREGLSAAAFRTVVVADTIAPVVVINGDAEVLVPFRGTYTELGATATDSFEGSRAVSVSGSVNTNQVGTYVRTYSASDSSGNVGTATRTVRIVDVTAPSLSSLTLSSGTLKVHPNGNYQQMVVHYTVSDDADPNPTLVLSVTSSDPDSGTGPRDRPDDIIIEDNRHVRLRRELSPGRPNRVYTFTVRATDASGNVATASATVTVLP